MLFVWYWNCGSSTFPLWLDTGYDLSRLGNRVRRDFNVMCCVRKWRDFRTTTFSEDKHYIMICYDYVGNGHGNNRWIFVVITHLDCMFSILRK